MDLDAHIENGLLRLRVIPRASTVKLVEDRADDARLRLYIKEAPAQNKANAAVIKFFKKNFGLCVEIKSGTKSRDKVLRIVA